MAKSKALSKKYSSQFSVIKKNLDNLSVIKKNLDNWKKYYDEVKIKEDKILVNKFNNLFGKFENKEEK